MHTQGFRKTNLCTKHEVPSSNSFLDMLDRLPEILEVTRPRPHSFWEKLFMRPLGFPNSQDEAM